MALELPGSHRATGLVDVLDRVLDKGLVIAGDIKVSLAEVELLTPGAARAALGEQEDLRAEIRQLTERVEALTVAQGAKRPRARRRR